MLDLALKAGIPFVGIQTDDLVNLHATLKTLSPRKILEAKGATVMKTSSALFVAYDIKFATPDLYEQMGSQDSQLVFVNCEPNPLVYDAGTLHPPEDMLAKHLQDLGLEPDPLLPVLRGLSLKAVSELLMMTEAKYGEITLASVRAMRTLMGEPIQGLYPQDTTYDFYQFPAQLKSWLEVNKPYFLQSEHQKLVPRGILFQGAAGTGKTMAAKAIANALGVPLYRLDIGTTMDKYTGVSEFRLQRILQQVEKEQPCVLLVDEIEKAFNETDDGGVTSRLLGQLLWWLSEHRSRVLTVMTANSLTIPPELYRAGRIDLAITIQKLTLSEAKLFADRVLQSIVKNPQMAWKSEIFKLLEAQTTKDSQFAHAEVAELVYSAIKKHQWVL